MAIFPQQRSAMMHAGAHHREVPAIGDRHVEFRQRILGSQRVGKHEERAITRQRLQPARGFDRSSNHCAELIDKKVYSSLTAEEEAELEELQRKTREAIDKAYPLPPSDLAALRRLEEELRGREGSPTP